MDTFQATPPVPSGAGTGEFGVNTGTSVGFGAGQNQAVLSGQRLNPTFTTDVAYQLSLLCDTTLTVAVTNLFDREPQFSRGFLGYEAFVDSPLGRKLKFSVRKTF